MIALKKAVLRSPFSVLRSPFSVLQPAASLVVIALAAILSACSFGGIGAGGGGVNDETITLTYTAKSTPLSFRVSPGTSLSYTSDDPDLSDDSDGLFSSTALSGSFTVTIRSTVPITNFVTLPGDNGITSIDFSNAPSLAYVVCDDTDLKELDVSNNPLLEYLFCQNNTDLKSINVSRNLKLVELQCQNNSQLETVALNSKNSGGTLRLLRLQGCNLSKGMLELMYQRLPIPIGNVYIHINGNPGADTADDSKIPKNSDGTLWQVDRT